MDASEEANLESADLGDLFQDPEGYYPPPPPHTTQIVTLASGQQLPLHLVGKSSLEGHHLWNGGRFISKWLEERPEEVKGKTVLELGAASGLPSLMCGVLGSRKVVMTDYPEQQLIDNMVSNVGEWKAVLHPEEGDVARVMVEGFKWSEGPERVLRYLAMPSEGKEGDGGENDQPKFDVLILADLLFLANQHENLVKVIETTMSRRRESKAFVFFTSYRPWMQERDMSFFDLARERAFLVEKVFEKKLEKPMFENDPGDLDVQKLVTGWTVMWPGEKCDN